MNSKFQLRPGETILYQGDASNIKKMSSQDTMQNIHERASKNRALFLAAGLVLSCTLLLGCNSRPPGCSDADVISYVKKDLLKLTPGEDPEIHRTWLDGLKLSGIKITKDKEFKEDGLCAVTMKVDSATGDKFDFFIAFTSVESHGKSYRVPVAAQGMADLSEDKKAWVMTQARARADRGAKLEVGSSQFESPKHQDASAAAETPATTATPAVPVMPATSATKSALLPGEDLSPANMVLYQNDWCSKATSFVEKTICASPKLVDLDLKVMEAYQNKLGAANEADRGAFRLYQRNWITKARDKCSTEACIVEAYERRLAEF